MRTIGGLFLPTIRHEMLPWTGKIEFVPSIKIISRKKGNRQDMKEITVEALFCMNASLYFYVFSS